MGVSFLLMSIETWLKPVVSISGLLAVVSMACVLKLKCTASVSARLSQKFGKLWLAAEVCFLYSGCFRRYPLYLESSPRSLAMIFAALLFRTFGVTLCVPGTNLTAKEKLFCPSPTAKKQPSRPPSAPSNGHGPLVDRSCSP